MISVGGFDRGFTIHTSNEKKPGIFIVRNPELTTHLVNLESNTANEEAPPAKRKTRKLAPVS